MYNIVKKILAQIIKPSTVGTKEEAKKRLKLVLAQDRSVLTASLLERMRKDILIVLSKYVELDSSKLEFSIRTDDKLTALIASLPVKKIVNQQQTKPQP